LEVYTASQNPEAILEARRAQQGVEVAENTAPPLQSTSNIKTYTPSVLSH